jgi:four helix bundle protein
MTPQELRDRTKTFALDVIRLVRRLPRTEECRIIGRQLLRAGTSVGANYRAACRSKSDPHFIDKLSYVIEEADESGYWIEILVAAKNVSAQSIQTLYEEAEALTRIFVASRETVRRRLRAARIKNHKSQITSHKSQITNRKVTER